MSAGMLMVRPVATATTTEFGRTDPEVLGVLVHGAFDVGGDGTRALVEHAELWEVVEQACDAHLQGGFSADRVRSDHARAHALLLTTAQDILPLFPRVES